MIDGGNLRSQPWRERCRRIFVEKHKDEILIAREIILEFREWFK
jgi:hypothetical protein